MQPKERGVCFIAQMAEDQNFKIALLMSKKMLKQKELHREVYVYMGHEE